MTTRHDPAAGTFGNCMQATLASLLELPIDQVPHFLADGTTDGNVFCQRLNEWLRPMNMAYVMIPPFAGAARVTGIKGLHHEVSGPSPREAGYWHACCGVDGKLTHDPHSSRDGVDIQSWGIFMVLDPSKPAGVRR